MSARKAQNLVDLWPAELVAMTGNRMRYIQVKKIMRHVCDYFSDQISCSITNSAASSPCKEQPSPSTVQKTVKRAQLAMVSNRKRAKNAVRDTSQEQTTSKKLPTSVVAIHRNHYGRENSYQQNVVTPARISMSKSKQSNIQKVSSQEKSSGKGR